MCVRVRVCVRVGVVWVWCGCGVGAVTAALKKRVALFAEAENRKMAGKACAEASSRFRISGAFAIRLTG